MLPSRDRPDRDRYWRRPRRVGGAVEGFSDPRGYFISVPGG